MYIELINIRTPYIDIVYLYEKADMIAEGSVIILS
jgi:hypothetical protein